MQEALIALVAILIILNIAVSIYLIRLETLNTFQKVSQLTIVWLLPLLGAIGLWLLNNDIDNPKPPKGPLGGGSNDSIGAQ